MSSLINRNVNSTTGRTSLRVEPEMWDALKEISAREKQTIHQLVRQIESVGYSGSRTSAVRAFVLRYYRALAEAILDKHKDECK